MKKYFSPQHLEIFLLALVAFAPWHGIVRFLSPLELSGALAQMSSKGLFNLFLIGGISAAFILQLVPSFRAQRPHGGEIFALAWLAYNVLNFRRIDAPGVVALECAVLLALLLLALFRRDEVVGEASQLKRYGLPVFCLSYIAAMALPLLFSARADIFVPLGPVNRFTGWSSTGSIAYSGVALGAWGIMAFCGVQEGRWQKGWGLLAIVLGVVGQHLTVLRIGLLALFLALVLATLHMAWQKRFKVMLQIGALALITMFTFLSKTLLSKSYISEKEVLNSITVSKTSHRKKAEKKLTPEEVIAKDPYRDPYGVLYQRYPSRISTALESMKPMFPSLTPLLERLQRTAEVRFMNFNSITHGRVRITHELFLRSKGQHILGHGTGATVRLMQGIDPGHAEPHNDYLRIFIDHGLVGLLIFFAMIRGVLKELRFNITVVAPLVASLLMLTDNFLVYPIVCFLPLIVSMMVHEKS